MASAGSTYARAFADVVFSTHLDADGSIAELRSIAGLLAESSELRRVGGNSPISPRQKRGGVGAIPQRGGNLRPGRELVAVLIGHWRVCFFETLIWQLVDGGGF